MPGGKWLSLWQRAYENPNAMLTKFNKTLGLCAMPVNLFFGRVLFIILLIVIVGLRQSHAREFRTFVNPGIKLGYTFGDQRGFTIGLECSITRMVGGSFTYGGVAAVDFCRQLIRIHAGVQASKFIGIEWGPTFIRDGSESHFGHSLTPFLGFVAYPYYTMTFRGYSPTLHEVGSYLKAPIKVAGPDFNLGGN